MDVVARELGAARAAHEGHARRELVAQQLDRASRTRLATGRETVEHRARRTRPVAGLLAPDVLGDRQHELELAPLVVLADEVPAEPEAKPHCVLSASRSTGTKADASSMRRLTSSADSISPVFVVRRPRTTTASSRTNRSGSKPPARSVSYSSMRRS